MLFAQISDLHVRMPGQKAYGIVETDRFLPPAIAALNRLEPRPDMVVISGDLTDFGRPEEYAHVRDMLDELKIAYYLMPGNHDVREVLREAFPEHEYLRQMEQFMQFAIETYPIRLLALDTVVPLHGHGELCEQRLQWLADRLAEQPGRPTVIAMHHPPFATGIVHMDAMGLRQGTEELRALVSTHPNVERIICGHVHRSITTRFAGTVVSVCPSVAHQIALDLRPEGPAAFVMEPPGFHLHVWSDGSLVTHAATIDDFPGPYPFQ